MADFLTELLELMPHELSAQPGITDAKGDFTPSGALVAVPCQIEGENKLVADQLGREVTSTRVAVTGEFVGFTIDEWRFDLPVGFPEPRAELKALAIDPASDEDGLLFEVVRFP